MSVVSQRPFLTGPLAAAWTAQHFDLTPFNSATMQVRFGFSVCENGAFVTSGWNVDDVVVSCS